MILNIMRDKHGKKLTVDNLALTILSTMLIICELNHIQNVASNCAHAAQLRYCLINFVSPDGVSVSFWMFA